MSYCAKHKKETRRCWECELATLTAENARLRAALTTITKTAYIEDAIDTAHDAIDKAKGEG